MAYTRKVRVEYYQVVEAKKDGTDRDKLFDLETLLYKAKGLTHAQRTYNYYQEKARLDKFRFHKSSMCYYLNFVRLRQTKIPVRARMNSESTPIRLAIDEYIGEDVSAVYDKNNNILALQRNRDSLSASGIEYYLTELYDSADYGIYLRPVPFKGVEKKLSRAKTYRKLTMKFATDKLKKSKIPEETSFGKLLSFTNPYESKSVVISLSMGRFKGTMDGETITEVIQDINKTDNFVTGAELSVKYNDSDPVDTIDLFAMKYHNLITIKMEELQSIDYVEMCNKIRGTYLANRKDILNSIS
ncbi:DUF6731 family protein [Anaerosporobacter sp.]|uniref:DUF6731 family protein n=1 Tax=Anaerosporobacter sp. TaxID=1872529 RepID=UPI00286F79D1|nr:DUF6731 family protein [Anaerosporobacter sp.]